MAPLLPALRAARRPGPPVATSFTDAVATRVVEAVRGPDRTAPPEAARALARLERLPDAVARARLRLVLLVLGLGSLRWLECLGVGLAVRAWLRHRTPSARPPAARPLAPPRADGAIPRMAPPAGTDGPDRPRARRRRGAGRDSRVRSRAHFAAAPDWPGSLRGHDREPGGLGRHTERVLARMAQASAAWPPEGRMAAAVVAAAHDLGKLVAYRRVGPDRWVGSGATPHDCLSAMILTRCPSWPAFASPETRAGDPPGGRLPARPRGAAGQRGTALTPAPRGARRGRRRRGTRRDFSHRSGPQGTPRSAA